MDLSLDSLAFSSESATANEVEQSSAINLDLKGLSLGTKGEAGFSFESVNEDGDEAVILLSAADVELNLDTLGFSSESSGQGEESRRAMNLALGGLSLETDFAEFYRESVSADGEESISSVAVDTLGISLDSLALQSLSLGEDENSKTALDWDVRGLLLETSAVEFRVGGVGAQLDNVALGLDASGGMRFSKEETSLWANFEALDLEVGRVSNLQVPGESGVMKKAEKLFDVMGDRMEIGNIRLHAVGSIGASFTEERTLVEGDFDSLALGVGIGVSLSTKEDISEGNEASLDIDADVELELAGSFNAAFNEDGFESARVRLERAKLGVDGDISFYEKDSARGIEKRLDLEIGAEIELGGVFDARFTSEGMEIEELNLEKIAAKGNLGLDYFSKDTSKGEETKLKGDIGLDIELLGSFKADFSDGDYSIEEFRVDKTSLALDVDGTFSKVSDEGANIYLDADGSVEFSALGGPNFHISDEKVDIGLDFEDVVLSADLDVEFLAESPTGSKIELSTKGDIDFSASELKAGLLLSEEKNAFEVSLADPNLDTDLDLRFQSRNPSRDHELDLDLSLDLDLDSKGRVDFTKSPGKERLDIDFDELTLETDLDISLLNKKGAADKEIAFDMEMGSKIVFDDLVGEIVSSKEQTVRAVAFKELEMEALLGLSSMEREISSGNGYSTDMLFALDNYRATNYYAEAFSEKGGSVFSSNGEWERDAVVDDVDMDLEFAAEYIRKTSSGTDYSFYDNFRRYDEEMRERERIPFLRTMSRLYDLTPLILREPTEKEDAEDKDDELEEVLEEAVQEIEIK